MARLSRVGLARLGVVLFVLLASVSIATLGWTRGPGSLSSAPASLPCRDGGPNCIGIGFTDAWFDGGTVQLEYSHRFFCAGPPSSDASSGCEAGQAATIQPPSGPVVSNVYLLIPVGFSPPEETLHCPLPGRCIDHPPTIDLSRVVKSQDEVVLPAHSFVIEDQEAFQSTWWPMVLVLVKNLAAWNTIAAAKSIAAVDACQANGGCFPEIDTNAFLFFQVLGPGMSPQGPA